MQNRLTKKSIVKEIGYVVDNPTVERCVKVIDKLGEYEDAEENGLLVRLPCKVGDTVYVAYPETRSLCDIHPCTVQSIYLTDDNNSKARSHLNIKSHISMFTKRMNLDQIGKTVFLTREEAEKALEEDKQRAETEEV